jgi:hypothetical protein
MGKFRSVFQYDDPFVEDGDISFIGLDQITEPTRLEPSLVTEAENVRIEEGVAKSRGGLKLMFSSSVSVSPKALTQLVTWSPPLGTEKLIVMGLNEDQYYIDDTTLSNPTSNVAFIQEYAWQFRNTSFPSRTPVFNHAFRVIQAYDQLIIFPSYASGVRPYIWYDGITFSGSVNRWKPLDANHTMYLQDSTANPTAPHYVDLSGNPSSVPVQDPSFMVCPQAPFGIYFQNRLIVPWFDDSPTSVAISDSFENNLFKKSNAFFLNKGQGDVLLALAPYLEDQILCLCKKSIHIISNISTLESGGRATEITRQLGIAGTNAWTQNGSYIYFISNEGDIQVLVPQLDPSKGLGIAISKVNLDSEPLSKKIPNILKRVNVDAIDTSILHYHKNLVYCALPLDGAVRPNHILVYDSLRSQFISLDSFSEKLTKNSTFGFNISDIHTFQDEVYISTDREVYKYSDLDRDESEAINFKLVTRSYLAQDYGAKKFVQGRINYDIGGEQIVKQGGYFGSTNNSDIEVGTKIKILSTRTTHGSIVNYNLNYTSEWITQGSEYIINEVNRSSSGYIQNIHLNKDNGENVYDSMGNRIDWALILFGHPLSPASGWIRDVDYEVIVSTKLEVTANTNSPTSSTKVKEIDSLIESKSNFQTFNIRQRGQSANLEFKSNGKASIRSAQVEAVIQNARNIGDYS